MLTTAPPTDQRAGVRPIAFLLNDGGSFGAPVTLKVRPEDLQRTEPSRISVTQTLGRVVSGWSDNFGAGLPSCTISGHTGWRAGGASGEDGAQHFETLNTLVMSDYHRAKQATIERGGDPAEVKLIFIDMLDNFCWNVAPMNFQLRRSRSRPLLFQYNIQLQAIATDIDNPLRILPFLGDITTGIDALDGVLGKLESFADKIKGWIADAVALKDRLLAPIANVVAKFHAVATRVFATVNSVVSAAKNAIGSTVNSLIGIAGQIADVGVGLFRTISNIASLPNYLKSAIGRVGSAYNEVGCILRNSLRPRKTYDYYDGLYGASNCSSTTGGRGPSQYANMNAFELMQVERGPVELSSSALASVSAMNRGDPVLAPIPLQEIGRHLENINGGVHVRNE